LSSDFSFVNAARRFPTPLTVEELEPAFHHPELTLMRLNYPLCPFSTSGSVIPVCHDKGTTMKALALLTAAALTLLSVAASAQTGPYYGKGKAPPPPVVTKG